MKHTGESSSNLMGKNGTITERVCSPGSAELEEKPPALFEHKGCGFGRCRPRFLQVFANPIVFMIVLNIYCLVEGAIVSGKLVSVCIQLDL